MSAKGPVTREEMTGAILRRRAGSREDSERSSCNKSGPNELFFWLSEWIGWKLLVIGRAFMLSLLRMDLQITWPRRNLESSGNVIYSHAEKLQLPLCSSHLGPMSPSQFVCCLA
jgi:hypothetical protein